LLKFERHFENRKGGKPYKIKVFRHFSGEATSQIRTGDPFITSEVNNPIFIGFIGCECEKTVRKNFKDCFFAVQIQKGAAGKGLNQPP